VWLPILGSPAQWIQRTIRSKPPSAANLLASSKAFDEMVGQGHSLRKSSTAKLDALFCLSERGGLTLIFVSPVQAKRPPEVYGTWRLSVGLIRKYSVYWNPYAEFGNCSVALHGNMETAVKRSTSGASYNVNQSSREQEDASLSRGSGATAR